MLRALLLTTALAAAAAAPSEQRVCYDELDEDLRCFSTGGPFYHPIYRPVNTLPQSPDRLQVEFILHTRANPLREQLLKYNDPDSLRLSNFNASRPTVFIAHGFLQNGRVDWIREYKRLFLLRGDYNAIAVNYGAGSVNTYTQAVANVRLVGALLAQLIRRLETVAGARREDIHIVGHSLGSMVAGYAGEAFKRDPSGRKIGRITGLDPADPYFKGMGTEVRLDPDDAAFVDVIHTDGGSSINILQLNGGMGMYEPCGHIDFYPNGGLVQPNCSGSYVSKILTEGLYNGTKYYVACYHIRVLDYFSESIMPASPMNAYECADYAAFERGECLTCPADGCYKFGVEADKTKPPPGVQLKKVYLDTTGRRPFCGWHYGVSVRMAAGGWKHSRVTLWLKLFGTGGESDLLQLDDTPVDRRAGANYRYTVVVPTDLIKLAAVQLHWTYSYNKLMPHQFPIFQSMQIFVESIALYVADSKTTINVDVRQMLKAEQTVKLPIQ